MDRKRTHIYESDETLEHAIQSDKMVNLGQLVAGIVHEMNTPTGAIGAAIVNMIHHLQLLIETFLMFSEQEMPWEDVQRLLYIVADMTSDLSGKHRRHSEQIRTERKRVSEMLQQQDVQDSWKFARNVAQLNLTKHVDELLALAEVYDIDDIFAFLTHWSRIITAASDIKLSSDMLISMVRALKSYSYPKQEKPVLSDIHESIDTSLTILHNKLKHRIDLERRYGDVPNIWCYSTELIHVWMNLIHNAIQAIDGKGTIIIETFTTDDHLGVNIIDSGPGIPAEIQDRIFEVSFTTKAQGEGTGLGLYLVQRIIEKHQGRIEIVSSPGKTTVTVYLPLSFPLYDLSDSSEN